MLAATADQTVDFRIYVTVSDVSVLDQKTEYWMVLKDPENGTEARRKAVFVKGD